MRTLIAAGVLVYAFQVEASGKEGGSPVPDDQWNDDVKLWTARSVLGEVGWDRPGEWAAVLWVYANRAERSKRYTFYEMVRNYSAAVKPGNRHRNPWLFHLRLDKTRPREWPRMTEKYRPRWRGLYDASWIRTIRFVETWQEGKVKNPCPNANHFGGRIDRHRAETLGWMRIKCNERGHRRFRNFFYDSTRRKKRPPQLRDAWRFIGFGRRCIECDESVKVVQ